jgi:hypothetical protein
VTVSRSVFPPDVTTLIMPLLDALASQRLIVLACIGADPVTQMPAFEKAGGSSSLFAGLADEDLLAIFTALEHTRDVGQDQVFAARSARFLLKESGEWSDEDNFGGGEFPGRWTLKGLVRLFERFYACASITTMHTARLVDLHQRVHSAYEHYRQIRALLEPTFEDIARQSTTPVVEADHCRAVKYLALEPAPLPQHRRPARRPTIIMARAPRGRIP